MNYNIKYNPNLTNGYGKLVKNQLHELAVRNIHLSELSFSAETPQQQRLFPVNPWMAAWHQFVWENQAPI